MAAPSGLGCALAVSVSIGLSIGGCAGEDFQSGGDASSTGGVGAGASGGATGLGAACATAGSAGNGPGECVAELYCATCAEMSTAVPSCDQCARANCCEAVTNCTTDLMCARLMSCYYRNCFNQSASNCIFAACPGCVDGTGLFMMVASCIVNKCKNTDAGDLCPQLEP